MAATKTTDLVALTAPVPDDLLYIVDDVAVTPIGRKITLADVAKGFQTIVCAGQSLTGSQADSLVSLAATWNTTGTPTALDLNVTDTASNAASLLMNLRVGGVSQVSVSKAGLVDCKSLRAAVGLWTTGVGVVVDVNSGFYNTGANQRIRVRAGNTDVAGFRNDGLHLSLINFGGIDSGLSTVLQQDAANTLAQRNGANAQAFNLYGTWTSASVFERAFLRYSTANTRFELGTEHEGASVRDLGILASMVVPLGTISAPFLRPEGGASNTGLFWTNTTNLSVAITGNERFRFGSGGLFSASSGVSAGNTVAAPHVTYRSAAENVALVNGGAASTTGCSHELIEVTAPAAPAADRARFYIEDNGAGKTRLMILFQSGVAQQIAIEP